MIHGALRDRFVTQAMPNRESSSAFMSSANHSCPASMFTAEIHGSIPVKTSEMPWPMARAAALPASPDFVAGPAASGRPDATGSLPFTTECSKKFPGVRSIVFRMGHMLSPR